MKKIVLASLMMVCLPYWAMSQSVDDDLYFIPKKKAEKKAAEEKITEQRMEEYTFKGSDLKSVTDSFIAKMSSLSMTMSSMSGFDMKI